MASHIVRGSNEYEEEIRQLVPYYDAMTAAGLTLLERLAPRDGTILDLGSGPGNLSSRILQALPDARLVLLDNDAEMVASARSRLQRFGDRVTFVQASFLDELPPSDFVVSCCALHHVHELPRKTELYRSICDSLPAGGGLLNLDVTIARGARLTELIFDRLIERMGDSGIEPADARRYVEEWQVEEDTYFPLEDELAAMGAAGFDEVACLWRDGFCAIECALRTA